MTISILIMVMAGVVAGTSSPPSASPPLPEGVVRCGTPDASTGIDPMAIVDRIDAHGRDLRTFDSRIRMDSYDDLAGETERRFGRVWLETPTTPTGTEGPRNAAVLFERTVEASGRSRDRIEHFVYRDGVLEDYDHEARLLVRRRLVRSDEDRDPLRLGAGSIPIPVGQRKVDMVKAFEIGPASKPPTNLVSETTLHEGIRLVPKAGTKLAADGKISHIEYWVSPADGAPIAVRVTESDGDRVAVRFFDPRSNPSFDADGRRWLDPPAVDPAEWRIQSR